jgi:hypothetical protein
MRRAIQVALRVVAGLTLAVALLVLAVRLFVATPPGQRFVLERLHRALPGVELTAARLAGDPLSRVVLAEPSLRLCGEGRVLRARAIEARYRLIPFLAGERRLALVVLDPSLAPDHGACPAVSGALPRLRVDPLVVIGEGLRVEGRADLASRELDLELHATVRELPALRGALTLDGRLRGPLDDLRLAARGGPLAIDGRVDAPARRAALTVRFDRVPLRPPETSVSLLASGEARVRVDGGELALRAKGDYSRRAADGEKLPGGGFTARASGERGAGGLVVKFEIDLDDAGVAARLVGAPEVSRGSRVTGTLTVPAGGRPELAADVVTR